MKLTAYLNGDRVGWFDQQNGGARAKLAMSYDGHSRTFEIEPKHLVREAEPLGLSERPG